MHCVQRVLLAGAACVCIHTHIYVTACVQITSEDEVIHCLHLWSVLLSYSTSLLLEVDVRRSASECNCVCVCTCFGWTAHVQRRRPRIWPHHSHWCGGTRWTSWWTSCCLCPPSHLAQSSRCVCWPSSWSDACRAGSVERKGNNKRLFALHVSLLHK